ncbi:Fur family transcriptional regulator [Streptomyces sp. NPDC093085]|uniref:Fur family transcriptional regulator n=1 Tax=Streptomyces sp. NPDC093085 TaxID=3155068 RepID=UPI00341D3676
MSTGSQPAHHDTTARPHPRLLLRQHGLRCTPGRLRILTLLSESGRHLSTTEACARLAQSGEAIHHTTVYRTLESLTAIGLTHAVHGPGPVRYGISTEPHHHTVCQQCGEISAVASEHLKEAAGKIEALTGLRPDSSGSLLVYGRCVRCG